MVPFYYQAIILSTSSFISSYYFGFGHLGLIPALYNNSTLLSISCYLLLYLLSDICYFLSVNCYLIIAIQLVVKQTYLKGKSKTLVITDQGVFCQPRVKTWVWGERLEKDTGEPELEEEMEENAEEELGEVAKEHRYISPHTVLRPMSIPLKSVSSGIAVVFSK